MRTEEQIIAELKELCVQDGYLNAVAHFCLMTGYIFYSEEIGSNEVSDRYSRKNLIDTEIKTILGFAIKNGINTQEVKPVTVQSYIDQTEELLKELHDSMGLTIRDELFSNSQSEAIPVRTPDEFPNSFFREVIFYCGMSAHNFQFHEFAIEKYKNDNDWLQKTYGVSIQDCVTICKAISDRVLENINSTRSDKTKSSKVLTDGNFLINLFKFNLSEIAKQSELDKNIVQSFMKLFSVDDTERNNLFSELNDYNVIQAKPIIQISSHEYLSLDSTSLYQAIYESPFYWMMRDTGYTNIAVENRGRFAEEFVFNKLSEIFGINNVYKNIDIYSSPSNRLGEIDILVQYSDRIFIVQTKSKGLTLAAQKCNDNTLRGDFKKAVQDAYDQGLICAKALLENKNYLLDSEKNRVEIKHKINDIFIICSTSSHYPAISVQSAHFLKYETSNIIHPPYVLDIFFFDILCEFLNDPLYFMDFLKKRLRYIKSLRATHEHTILSYHLQHNLYFSEKYDCMSLDDDIAQD
ncbi:nuclease-related domain-containing protein [Denitrovibrio acetiphilus]|uniref:nuclease-related domain-containing protein n=1 Tax=Denitrovibrio acetiphilus TaxID=118000 RepID=UPI00019B3E14|nr:nuclease-related domain-containing protein [Denitrovibrio acetiphilus]